MSAIDEMYEKYGFRAHPLGCTNEDVIEETGFVAQDICKGDCLDCTWYDSDEYYPDFTAEKQLELIKLIACEIDFRCTYLITDGLWKLKTNFYNSVRHQDFAIALADLMIVVYKEFSQEQIQEVKEILER